MRLIATRQATAAEVEIDEVIQSDGKRYVVDEVHHTRTGLTVYGNEDTASLATSRRKTFEFSAEQRITVEAGEADRRELIDVLQQLLAGDEAPNAGDLEYDAKTGTLTINIGTRVVGNTAGRFWSVLFEA